MVPQCQETLPALRQEVAQVGIANASVANLQEKYYLHHYQKLGSQTNFRLWTKLDNLTHHHRKMVHYIWMIVAQLA